MPYRKTQRSEKRRATRRAQLLAAAKKLFAAQGYEATTMQQVVVEAGTSIGNCYFYFRNKEDLLLAVVEEFEGEIGQAIDEAVALLPAGPNQLIVAVYVGIVSILSQANLAHQILLETANPALRLKIIAYFTERVRHFFAANPALLGGVDLELVAHAWQGAPFNLLEKVLAGEITQDPITVARFLARWNLQALGLPEPQVLEALATLDQVSGLLESK